MKKIEVIIKPYLLNEVKRALQEFGIIGMTISEIKNFHPAAAASGIVLQESWLEAGFEPCLKLEIVVDNACLDDVIAAVGGADPEHSPSEHLIVQELDDVIRIRTSEHGVGAI